MEKLVIDRLKWLRGSRHGISRLHRYDGLMCCLGFECLRRGAEIDDIRDMASPAALAKWSPSLAASLVGDLIVEEGKRWGNTQECIEAMEVNDETKISDQQRESILVNIFAAWGVELTFES